jgi:hypothetical protein
VSACNAAALHCCGSNAAALLSVCVCVSVCHAASLEPTPQTFLVRPAVVAPPALALPCAQVVFKHAKLRNAPFEWVYDGLAPALLPQVLHTSKGMPLSLALAAAGVGSRLGMQLQLVCAPEQQQASTRSGVCGCVPRGRRACAWRPHCLHRLCTRTPVPEAPRTCAPNTPHRAPAAAAAACRGGSPAGGPHHGISAEPRQLAAAAAAAAVPALDSG